MVESQLAWKLREQNEFLEKEISQLRAEIGQIQLQKRRVRNRSGVDQTSGHAAGQLKNAQQTLKSWLEEKSKLQIRINKCNEEAIQALQESNQKKKQKIAELEKEAFQLGKKATQITKSLTDPVQYVDQIKSQQVEIIEIEKKTKEIEPKILRTQMSLISMSQRWSEAELKYKNAIALQPASPRAKRYNLDLRTKKQSLQVMTRSLRSVKSAAQLNNTKLKIKERDLKKRVIQERSIERQLSDILLRREKQATIDSTRLKSMATNFDQYSTIQLGIPRKGVSQTSRDLSNY